MFIKTIIMGFIRFISSLGLLALVNAAVIGLLARNFWWAELATHFVVHIWAASIVLVVLFLIQLRWDLVGLTFVIFVWHSYLVFPLFVTPEYTLLPKDITAESPKATRILQYNLHFTDIDVVERMKWVASQASSMDVIVLLEVSDRHLPLIQGLETQFPYHFIKPMREYRGVAVFSRLKDSKFVLRDTVGNNTHYVVMSALDKSSGQPLALFAIHPPPPISPDTASHRNEYFQQLTDEVKMNTAANKIIVGDFNLTRWSPYFKDLQKATDMVDSFEGFGIKSTWPSWLPQPLRITIDNLLIYENPVVTGHMVTLDKQIGPANGSDHFPVITTLY